MALSTVPLVSGLVFYSRNSIFSHQRSGDGEREERGAAEMEKLLSFEASETSLRSDMLISMNVT